MFHIPVIMYILGFHDQDDFEDKNRSRESLLKGPPAIKSS